MTPTFRSHHRYMTIVGLVFAVFVAVATGCGGKSWTDQTGQGEPGAQGPAGQDGAQGVPGADGKNGTNVVTPIAVATPPVVDAGTAPPSCDPTPVADAAVDSTPSDPSPAPSDGNKVTDTALCVMSLPAPSGAADQFSSYDGYVATVQLNISFFLNGNSLVVGSLRDNSSQTEATAEVTPHQPLQLLITRDVYQQANGGWWSILYNSSTVGVSVLYHDNDLISQQYGGEWGWLIPSTACAFQHYP